MLCSASDKANDTSYYFLPHFKIALTRCLQQLVDKDPWINSSVTIDKLLNRVISNNCDLHKLKGSPHPNLITSFHKRVLSH